MFFEGKGERGTRASKVDLLRTNGKPNHKKVDSLAVPVQAFTLAGRM